MNAEVERIQRGEQPLRPAVHCHPQALKAALRDGGSETSVAREEVANLSAFIWSIAEILRGEYKQSEYGKVILPFVVMRRLDCLLEPTKQAVLEAAASLSEHVDEQDRDSRLFAASGDNIRVYNTSRFTFKTLQRQDPRRLFDHLVNYINGFSSTVRDIFTDKFRFVDQLKRLNDNALLRPVFDRFCEIDLHPDRVSNYEMGLLFEELIRRFSEISHETAGEHFTPRDVIRLIVDLLLANDGEKLSRPGVTVRVYDPAAGTGGMLTITEAALKEHNPSIRVELYGQELNPESYAICQSDMLVKGHDPERIAFGNSLTHDAHAGATFHYMLTNPPFGVHWGKYREAIEAEAKERGLDGRFGAGLPRISDGQLLFLQHMIAKMQDDEQGSRIGIVMNGSPLFAGGAGSGESEIRRWLLENDWVEAIIALPTDLFYNTGIQTYIWLLTNRKPPERAGKVQLINASGERFWEPLQRSLGSKRRQIPAKARKAIVRLYAQMRRAQDTDGSDDWSEFSKILDVSEFGYREIRVERPLRLNFQVSEERLQRLAAERAFAQLPVDEQEAVVAALRTLPDTLFTNHRAFATALDAALRRAGLHLRSPVRRAIMSALAERDEDADPCIDARGNPEPDPELRFYERVPLKEDWREYVEREVKPFVPDAWVDESYRDERDGQVGRVGYEINFNRCFGKYVPPRSLDEINAELRQLEAEIAELLKEVAG